MACVQAAPTSGLCLVSIIGGGGSWLDKVSSDFNSPAYCVPKGCVVRNTFIEWQHEEDAEAGTLDRGATAAEAEAQVPRASARRQARARSCPEKVLLAAEPSASQSPEAHSPERRCPVQKRRSLPTISTDCDTTYCDTELTASDGSNPSFDDFRGPGQTFAAHDATIVAAIPGELCFFPAGMMGDNTGAFLAVSSPMTPERLPVGSLHEEQEALAWCGPWTPQTPTGVVGGNGADNLASPVAAGGAHIREPKSAQKLQKGRRWSGDQASLVLRGLPFNATEVDIVDFLSQHGVSTDSLAPGAGSISLLSNHLGKPSGFAEVLLNRNVNFWEVQEALHMKRLGGRYIEALPPRNSKFAWGATPSSTRNSTKRDGAWRRNLM